MSAMFCKPAGTALAIAAPAAENPDADLLVACARFESLKVAYRANCEGDSNTDLHCPAGYDEALQAVEDRPAHTLPV